MDYKILFGKTNPTKLFFIAAIPGTIGMLASALYQLIDGAFVGHFLGSDAFASVNLAMPFVIINYALADLIGVGSAVPIAIRLGEKKEAAASNIFTSACILIVGTGAVIGLLLFTSAPLLMRLMGAEGALADQAVQYLRVYAFFSPITTIVFAMDNYLRICGKVRYSMILNILLAVFGAVLEFLFLFVLRFGIWGASLATSIAMVFCAFLAVLPFLRGKLQLRFGRPKFSKQLLMQILSNGCPSFLNNIAGRITSIIMNIFLLRLGGADAVSVYGVLMYADGFIFPMLYGMCDSLQPAVGYNWGAGQYKRVVAIEKRCFGMSCLLSLLMALIIFLFPEGVAGIFVEADNAALIQMAAFALRLFAIAYLVRWISFATQSYMSAVGKPGYASLLSTSVAFIFPVILIFALNFMGLTGLWLNYPITSGLAAVLSAFILIRFHKSMPMEEQ